MVYVAADWMVMPLCLSSSIESMVAPTPSLPFTCTSHEKRNQPVTGDCSSIDLYDHTNTTWPGAHLVNLCYPPGVVEDTLGQGGLS